MAELGPPLTAAVVGLGALGSVLGEIAADLALDGTTRRPVALFSRARVAAEVGSPQVML